MATSVPVALRNWFEKNGQGHVFQFLDEGKVAPEGAAALVSQLESIDLALVNELFTATMEAAAKPVSVAAELTPCNDVTKLSTTSPAQIDAWRTAGLEAISRGQAAALILAGGQGTRLGFDRPKGEYDVGLPSHKTLFELQAARIQRLRVLASAGGATLPSLPLYIMTSPMTDKDTRAFWEAKNYFGLPRADVMFFSQGTLPCLSPEGKILLERGDRVAEAPDGNGGIYRALHVQGVVADMQKRGVVGVHVFAVDNAVVRAADPVFLGFCMSQGADVGSKVCPKAGPHEKVGVLCKVGGAYSVVEYSEMDAKTAELRDAATGELAFNTGNLCIHYYSTAFLATSCSPAALPKVYHLARKSIPVANPATGLTLDKAGMAERFKGANNGVKLESFIFDVFPAAKSMAVLEIDRSAEFSPVKNAPGSKEDSPDTARALISTLHRGWLQAAGASVEGAADACVEVSGLTSYAGEGLAALEGSQLQAPLLVLSEGEPLPAGAVVGAPDQPPPGAPSFSVTVVQPPGGAAPIHVYRCAAGVTRVFSPKGVNVRKASM